MYKKACNIRESLLMTVGEVINSKTDIDTDNRMGLLAYGLMVPKVNV